MGTRVLSNEGTVSQTDDCFWCGEPVLPGEGASDPVFVVDSARRGAMRDRHVECAIRAVIGSVGHQRGKCSCYGGTEEDPPGMTRRDAARVAKAEWAERMRTKGLS